MDYNVGDIVTYKTFGNEMRTVEVTNKEHEVFDGIPVNPLTHEREIFMGVDSVWGYNEQIVSVERTLVTN